MKRSWPWADLYWTNFLFLAGTHSVAVVGTILYASLHGFTWAAVGIAAALLAACGISITGGYHRLFAHGTYQAHPLVRTFYLIFGAAAWQNSALKWCSDHRRHHTYVDRDADPYNIRKGFWWAHVGWILFKDLPSLPGGKVTDLEADPLIVLQHRFYVPIAVLFGFGLPLAAGFLLRDPWGGLIIGGFLRTLVIHHSTFCVNSLAHAIGAQPYSDTNSSRDSGLTALVTMGEGYHNFHHTFPFDYRNGVRAFHFDPTKWVIRALSFVGLTRALVRTPHHVILKSRLRMQERQAGLRHVDRPQAAELLRAAREKLEHLLDRWAALKTQCADLRARLDRGSREALETVRRDLADARRRFREAYQHWFLALRRPELLAAVG